jgi:hypothetical protein
MDLSIFQFILKDQGFFPSISGTVIGLLPKEKLFKKHAVFPKN